RAVKHDLRAHRIRTVLADRHQIHGRWLLVRLAVGAVVTNRTRWTCMCDLDQLLDGNCIGLDPRSFDIREEHLWCAGHAEPRVDALAALVDQRELLARDVVDTVATRRHWWCARRHDWQANDRRWNSGARLSEAALRACADVLQD